MKFEGEGVRGLEVDVTSRSEDEGEEEEGGEDGATLLFALREPSGCAIVAPPEDDMVAASIVSVTISPSIVAILVAKASSAAAVFPRPPRLDATPKTMASRIAISTVKMTSKAVQRGCRLNQSELWVVAAPEQLAASSRCRLMSTPRLAIVHLPMLAVCL